MVRRTPFARLDRRWGVLCIWLIRRGYLRTDRTLRLLNFIARVTGLPRPCAVIA